MTPEELERYRQDPLLEKRSGQTEFVVCRECGFKGKWLHDHVRKRHRTAVDPYLKRWNFPPLFSASSRERQSETRKRWGAANDHEYFHTKDGLNKRHELSPGQPRNGKVPSPAMRRRALELAEASAGVPRPDLRGRKLLGSNRQGGKWVTAPPVDDATIVEARLLGKLQREIAEDVGRTSGAVQKVLERVGVPAWNFRLFQGAPLTARRISTLAEDFGVDLKRACLLLGLNYHHMLNRVREVHADRSMEAELAAKVLPALARAIETYCYRDVAGKHVREFLASEVESIRRFHQDLGEPLAELRRVVRNKEIEPNPTAVLNFICEKCRREEARKRFPVQRANGFQKLLLMWPSLRKLILRDTGFLRSTRRDDWMACELLGVEFGSSAYRISQLLAGEVVPLQPQSLAVALRTASASSSPKKPMKSPPRSRKLPSKQQDLSRYLDGAKLTDRQRECLSLNLEYGLGLAAISERLGLNRKTVYEHLDAAKRALQRQKERFAAHSDLAPDA